MIILCWTTKLDDVATDHYSTFESLIDATSAYQTVRAEPTTYSATLCKPFASTEPHYADGYPTLTFMTTDGYKFYLLEDGTLSDSLIEDERDMTFDSIEDFLNATQD
jgi:hypothetical protein